LAAAPEAHAEIASEEAVHRVLEAIASGASHEVLATERVVLVHRGVPTPAWKVIVATASPSAEWRAYVDARTGAVLEQDDILRRVDGRGRVFDPSPVVTLDDPSLENSSPIPAAA